MDWDNDDEDEDLDEEEEEEEEDEEELFAKIEQAFRTERARIRNSEDLYELRTMRAEYQALDTGGRSQACRIRARDLIALVDDRVTDLKAKRLAEQRR